MIQIATLLANVNYIYHLLHITYFTEAHFMYITFRVHHRCTNTHFIVVLVIILHIINIQLLRPLTFTDISEVYTYSSPDIKYFHSRHVFYGMVAVFCELVIRIGLPVILIMEPLL